MNYTKIATSVNRKSLINNTDLIFNELKNRFINQLIMLNIEHVRRVNNYMGIDVTHEVDNKLYNKVESNVRDLTVPYPTVSVDPTNSEMIIFSVDIYKTLDTTCHYKFVIREEA